MFQLGLVTATNVTGISVVDEQNGVYKVRINSLDSQGATRPGHKPFEFWAEVDGENVSIFEGFIEFTAGALA